MEVFYLLVGISTIWGIGQGILNGPLYVSIQTHPDVCLDDRGIIAWDGDLQSYDNCHFYQALFADSVPKAERAKYYNYLFVCYVLPVGHRYGSRNLI